MEGSLATLAAAFVAGLASSAGPCVAQRYAMLGALTGAAGWSERVRSSALFVAGLACVYASFGAVASWLAHAVLWSTPIYRTIAALLVVNALRCVFIPEPPCGETAARANSRGGAFVLGAASALVVSPCCTPFAIAAATMASAGNAPLLGAAVLAVFAIGHGAPVVAAVTTFGGLWRAWRLSVPQSAASLVNGGVMLALGAYYAALA